MKRLKNIFLLCFCLLLCSCQANQSSNYLGVKGFTAPNQEKKVILLLIDSMTAPLIDSGLKTGDLPALQFLIEHGQYYKDIIAPFPSMSVTIESTLITGEMPDKHKVPGLSWYSSVEGRMIDYGTSFERLRKLGFSQSMRDSLYHLNNTHLDKRVETIHEALEKRGKTSGSINGLVYRGGIAHELHIPLYTNLLPGASKVIQTTGPQLLAFGQLSKPKELRNNSYSEGIFNKMGVNDQYSIKMLKDILLEGLQPDFLMVYFPDYDHEAHEHGLHNLQDFVKIDTYLQELLNLYGSWEKALEHNIFLVLGDQGVDQQIDEKKKVAIPVEDLLKLYSVGKLDALNATDELILAPNGRMAYIHFLHKQKEKGMKKKEISRLALQDNRVDMVAWKENDWIEVCQADQQDSLRFKRVGNWKDTYNQTWNILGNEKVLDLKLDQQDQFIHYGNYPDGLNQIYSALNSLADDALLVTAKPGYSLEIEGVPNYPNGGNHGGLHKNEVLTALIITGTDKKPKNLRMMDLKEYILDIIDHPPK